MAMTDPPPDDGRPQDQRDASKPEFDVAAKRGRLKDIARSQSDVAEKRGRLKQIGDAVRAFARRLPMRRRRR